ncbi:MAG: sulfate transporter family protein [Hyphomicrobiales bacterium]|nr:sulfate transporter family protein [Hyphomicrobiales bacterium]
MIQSALSALQQIFTPPFRTVLYKVLGLTIAVLTLIWFGLNGFIDKYIAVPWPWLTTTLQILTGVGLFAGMAFLIAPASSLIAGLFLDELAECAETASDPHGPPGTALPAGQAIILASRFALVSLLVNAIALLLLLVPGINLIAFFTANAYLLGREYFELAAMRYRPVAEAKALRERHGLYIFLCGMPVAAFLAVPILNLLTPLFATAFMVRIHKQMMRRGL